MTSPVMQDVIRRRLDDPLADCRDGNDAIGFVGPDVPIEILLASGRPFGHLPWRTDGRTDYADRWLESSFPFWARSIVEQWHQGAFDELGCVVFSRADDASQRLYYYVAELRRRGKLGGPAPHMFDIALIPRKTSEAHTVIAIIDLLQTLELSSAQLPAGIELANALRTQLAGIDSARNGNGPWYERLSRAVLWSDPTRWIGQATIPVASSDVRRVLFAGSVPPDERIHLAAETAAASIIAEAHPLALGRLGPIVELQGASPELALARTLRRESVSSRAFVDRGAWLVERARRARAEAVIIWLTREDEGLAWSVPSQQHALAAAGLPSLLLTAQRWQADDGVLDRVAAFCREGMHATA